VSDARSTLPVPAGMTWESYCEALGIDASNARQASLMGALAGMLSNQQETINAALDCAVHSCKTDH